MKLLLISDLHGALGRLSGISELISSSDLVAVAGDITKKGSRREAEEIIDAIGSLNQNIIAVHGNMDRDEVRVFLEERGIGIHGGGRIINGVGFFGVGGSNITPIHTRCEYTEEEIMGFLESGYRAVSGAETRVLLTHVPPKGARDRTFLFIRAGSVSVRDFLRNHDDIQLCLAGHIHEASGVEFMGPVCVANPGSFKSGRYLTVEIGDSISVKQGRIK